MTRYDLGLLSSAIREILLTEAPGDAAEPAASETQGQEDSATMSKLSNIDMLAGLSSGYSMTYDFGMSAAAADWNADPDDLINLFDYLISPGNESLAATPHERFLEVLEYAAHIIGITMSPAEISQAKQKAEADLALIKQNIQKVSEEIRKTTQAPPPEAQAQKKRPKKKKPSKPSGVPTDVELEETFQSSVSPAATAVELETDIIAERVILRMLGIRSRMLRESKYSSVVGGVLDLIRKYAPETLSKLSRLAGAGEGEAFRRAAGKLMLQAEGDFESPTLVGAAGRQNTPQVKIPFSDDTQKIVTPSTTILEAFKRFEVESSRWLGDYARIFTEKLSSALDLSIEAAYRAAIESKKDPTPALSSIPIGKAYADACYSILSRFYNQTEAEELVKSLDDLTVSNASDIRQEMNKIAAKLFKESQQICDDTHTAAELRDAVTDASQRYAAATAITNAAEALAEKTDEIVADLVKPETLIKLQNLDPQSLGSRAMQVASRALNRDISSGAKALEKEGIIKYLVDVHDFPRSFVGELAGGYTNWFKKIFLGLPALGVQVIWIAMLWGGINETLENVADVADLVYNSKEIFGYAVDAYVVASLAPTAFQRLSSELRGYEPVAGVVGSIFGSGEADEPPRTTFMQKSLEAMWTAASATLRAAVATASGGGIGVDIEDPVAAKQMCTAAAATTDKLAALYSELKKLMETAADVDSLAAIDITNLVTEYRTTFETYAPKAFFSLPFGSAAG